ncbi:MAG: inositol monophosphatase [Elusimicrobiales bacterium]|nr:inositol monophosphatase [Elusimicrobiales bacterium]
MKETEVLMQALKECGAILSEKVRHVDYALKGRANLVTEADMSSQKKAFDIIHSAFPDDKFIAEEEMAEEYIAGKKGTDNAGNGRIWIIDPLDGTTNYAHGFPQAAISIAFAEGGRTRTAGVFNPMMNELYSAEEGKGAYLNGKKISVSKTPKIEKSLLVTGFAYDRAEKADYYVRFFKEFMKISHDVRRLGAASLDMCWLAAGRTDGYWEFNLKPWDVAAGWLILEEAGGKVSRFDGSPWHIGWNLGSQTLATNGLIHNEMIAEIGKYI